MPSADKKSKLDDYRSLFLILKIRLARLDAVVAFFEFLFIRFELVGIAREFFVPLLFEIVVEVIIKIIVIKILKRVARARHFVIDLVTQKFF